MEILCSLQLDQVLLVTVTIDLRLAVLLVAIVRRVKHLRRDRLLAMSPFQRTTEAVALLLLPNHEVEVLADLTDLQET